MWENFMPVSYTDVTDDDENDDNDNDDNDSTKNQTVRPPDKRFPNCNVRTNPQGILFKCRFSGPGGSLRTSISNRLPRMLMLPAVRPPFVSRG